MAKGVNKVFLLGNVGKDPEIRATAGGMTIASFTLATADRAKDQSGQWVDKPEWHSLVCFDRLAEVAKTHVKKGSLLFVEGKITTRSWDDKDSGQKRFRTEIIVNDFQFVGGNRQSEDGASQGSGGYSRSNASSSSYGSPNSNANSGGSSQPDYADAGITDDDIPF
jgi:single-strand DNA-binding protein